MKTVFFNSPIPKWIPVFLLSLAMVCFADQNALSEVQQDSAPKTAQIAPADTAKNRAPIIIIGFVGGWVRHDNLAHAEVQLAASLHGAFPSGVYVETFENANGRKAFEKILALLDVNHDSNLTAAEKQDARIILYGHSWGASEAITVAGELGEEGIPVLLTVQVDSVEKRHENDTDIPTNVAQAVNFYQDNGFVHGQKKITAADPAKTKIIGNFKFNYRTSRYACTDYPWYDRVLAKAHTEIECDPNVWKQVDSLIRQNLPRTPPAEAKP
jgi:hypothetical protein